MLRRRDAKRFNEGVKILATFMNNLAVGAIIAGLLSPIMAGRLAPIAEDVGLVFASLALHIGAQTALRLFLKSED